MFQLKVFGKVSPICLYEWVSSIITPSIDIVVENTEFLFREINIDNGLFGLKVTSQLVALIEMALRSLFRSCPA